MEIERLPKSDLHRHLDGAIRLETILDLGLTHGLPIPADTLEGLRPHIVVQSRQPGLIEFLERFRWMVGVLVDEEACRRVAFENIEDAHREGIDYIELRFSPVFMARPHGLHPQAVVEAVMDGVRAGVEKFGVRARLIGILSRTFGVDSCGAELDALLACRDGLVAVDLAGDEANYPAEWFVSHFRRARDAGLQVTVHAGEAGGAPGIWTAVRDLGATRIGHGVRAIDDPGLMDHLVRNRIGVECCLTSNLQTSTVPDYPDHPIRQFLDAGILATLNTDDPGISGIDLHHELTVAATAAGLDEADVAQCLRNARAIAFDWRE